MFIVQKLRHYMKAHMVWVISKVDPIKWAVILEPYDLVYVPQKCCKGQALVDFLVDHPIPDE